MARRISSPVLVGREAELRAFDHALEAARSGHPSLLVLGGEAGAGKSRLVAEFAARTRAAGGIAAVGSAPPPAGDSRLPYAALTQALRAMLRSIDARLIDPLLGPARADLAALLPELGEAPTSVPGQDPFAAARLTEAVLVAVMSLAARRSPMLLALEDVHWADGPTLSTASFVYRNLVDAPVAMVMTYRTDAPRADDGLLDYLAELDRSPGTERRELGPLDPDEVGRQVRAIMGAEPEAELARAVARRSGGNPFFVEEIVLAVTQGGVDRPPPSVRAIVESRMSQLGGAGRGIVEALAVAGGPVAVDLLAAVCGLSTAVGEAALQEAREQHLVADGEAIGGLDDRVAIRHVLVAEVIAEGVNAPRRRHLHGRFAEALARHPPWAGGSALERHAVLASHLLLAGAGARAVPVLLAEASAAEAARAFDTAERAYGQAISTWRGVEQPAEASFDVVDVFDRAGTAASLAGHPRQAVTWAEEALAAFATGGSPGQDATSDDELGARLRMHLGRYLADAGWIDAAVDVARAACSAAPEGSVSRARSGAELARRLVAARRFEEAAVEAANAATIAAGLDAAAEEAGARSVQALAQSRLGRTAEALAALESAPQQRTSGAPTAGRTRPSRLPDSVERYLDRAAVLEQVGDLAGAVRVALEGRDEAARRGLATTFGDVLAGVAARDLLRVGEWDEAARLTRAPRVILAAPDAPEVTPSGATAPQLLLARALLEERRGEWVAAERDLAEASDRVSHLGLPGWAALPALVGAEMACWRRRYGEARATVDGGAGIATADADDDTFAELALLGIRVEAEAQAGSSPRRRIADATASAEVATGWWLRLYTTMAPTSASGAALGQGARAAALLATGEAEASRLAGPADAGAWRRAVDAWDAAADPYRAAYARLRLVDAQLEGAGDRTEAKVELTHALAEAERLAARPLAQQIEELARRARLAVRPEAAGASHMASRGYAEARRLGLSDREIEVLELVAAGLSDREIASRLFVTTKTAGHHVSHILLKLGVTRRGEAAAVAFRIGLAGAPAD